MNFRPAVRPLFIIVTTCLAQSALAQAPPDIDALREQSSISSDDQQRIARWIESRAADIESSAGDADRVSGIVREMVGKLDRATPAFRTAFVEETVKVGRSRFTSSAPAVKRALAEVLQVADEPAALDGLLAALQCDDVIARWRAAMGLISLRDRVGAAAPNVLSSLEQAARTEPHPLVRQTIYRAMLIPDRLDDGLAKLSSALASRRPQLEQAPPSAFQAEVELFSRLAAENSVLRTADVRGRADLARALAQYLVISVGRYLSISSDASPQDKERFERLVLQSERALRVSAREVAGGSDAPDVTGALTNGGADVDEKLRAQLDKWVGTEGTPGVLNQAPWDVPLGGLADATATAGS